VDANGSFTAAHEPERFDAAVAGRTLRELHGALRRSRRHGRSASSSGFPQSELVAEARRRVARALEPLTH